jgi:RNA polymerase sigma-70 factor (ECF subfamily)|nr:sigma-70 family RNA polymerase sigma factor [Kofleriaceae bacterium]
MTLATLGPTPARELDDVALARARRGDAAAFRALVETYQDRVFALLWRFLGRRAQAAVVDDLAQATFVGVWRALPRFRDDGPARLSTWVLAIAARTALKARRDDRVGDDVVMEALPAGGASPAQRADARAFADALAGAVDRLAPAYRAAFVLHAYHELDHAEIARALDVEVGTVKSRLARAREALRAELKEYAP